MKCATCGAELVEVGYPKDFYQAYRCPNGCEKIFGRWTRILDTAAALLVAFLFVLVAVMMAPLWFAGKIREAIA